MIKQTFYVVGFAFDRAIQNVVLIEKRRPKWQAGKHNGVGGHLEVGEAYQTAMEREFREETGVTIPAMCWHAFATLNSRDWTVRAFYTLNDDIFNCVSSTDERVAIVPVNSWQTVPHIPNLDYLIPLALDREQVGIPTFHFGAK